MIELIEKEIEKFETRQEKFNNLREILQILILKIIHDTGYFKNLVFTGGTALRIIYNLKRFSEDIDFSLVNKKKFKIEDFANILERELKNYNLEVELKTSGRVVKQINLKFLKILQYLNISFLPSQKLFIRVEIDTNPPEGGNMEISLINKIFIFAVVHFDLPSLFATKLHACFFRRYTKGRDFYDLLWYLTKGIQPNYVLLNNAIRQSSKERKRAIKPENFGKFLKRELLKVDFDKVKRDVERFLEDKREANLLNKENFLKLCKKYEI